MSNLNTNKENSEKRPWSTNAVPLNYDKGKRNSSSASVDSINRRTTSTNSLNVQSTHVHGVNDIDHDPQQHIEPKDNTMKSKMLLVLAVLMGIGIGALLVTMNNNHEDNMDNGKASAYETTISDSSAYSSASSGDTDTVTQTKENDIFTDTVNGYISTGDYEAAIRFIVANDVGIDQTPEIQGLYNSAVDGYRAQILDNAEEAFTEHRYEAAYLIVYKGLDVLPEDPILQTELEQYSDYIPVDLASITPYYEGYIDVFTQGATDTLGNYYYTGIRGYMSPSDNNCYNIWDIGGKYNILTATGIILESDKGSSYEGSYRIYGDGKLLYERAHIGSQTKPYTIEVDITGVTDLKIEMYGEGNITMLGIDSVLVDVMLQKTR